ncbi:hypothetical protein [Sediminicoccus sp. KRV36]|uniref:hypothetical protein n=1 Tax=Sediminicoccus sp. KRV36 TaxID=3133721 RepID=UPI002010A1C2|nr:hypothetical protein [Sediminicoccus rosea]UPY37592.1 hypothetical protein LHU95_02560 [Sediminicoccus rosea]
MTPAGHFTTSPEHPSLPGHFPGRPIVPGVLLLAEIFALLGAAHPGLHVAALEQAKFLRPVRPGEVVMLASRLAEAGRVHFTGMIGAEPALRGVARMQPVPG